MRGTTPAPALEKIVEARRQAAQVIELLKDARAIVAEQTNESIASGAGDLDAALFALLGDDSETTPVLGHLDAILVSNRRASEVWG